MKLSILHFYNCHTKTHRGLRDNNTVVLSKTVFLIKSNFSKAYKPMHDFHNSFTIFVFIINVSSESEIQLKKKIERDLFHFHYSNQ